MKFTSLRLVAGGLALLAGAELAAQLGTPASAGGLRSASTALLSTSASAAIRACAFEARNQLVFDIDTRLKAASGALGALEEAAKSLPAVDRDRFASILDDVRTQEAALRLHVAAAQKAEPGVWPTVRDALAYSYMDYVGAVSRAERAAADRENASTPATKNE